MIESLFIKKNDPIVLINSVLFIGLDYYDLDKTYIFIKQNKEKIEQFGEEWIVDHIVTDNVYKGYFSSPPYADFLGEKIYNRDDISLIGYSEKFRYFLGGLSINGNNFSFGEFFAAKFRFTSFKREFIRN